MKILTVKSVYLCYSKLTSILLLIQFYLHFQLGIEEDNLDHSGNSAQIEISETDSGTSQHKDCGCPSQTVSLFIRIRIIYFINITYFNLLLISETKKKIKATRSLWHGGPAFYEKVRRKQTGKRASGQGGRIMQILMRPFETHSIRRNV